MVVHLYRKGTTDEDGPETHLNVSRVPVFIEEEEQKRELRIIFERSANPTQHIPLDQIRWFFVEED